MGTSIYCSQQFGAGNTEEVRIGITTSLMAFLPFSIVLMIPGLLACSGILSLFSVPEEAWLPLPGPLRWGDWEISAQAGTYRGEPQRKCDFWLRLEGEWLLVRPRRTGDELTPVGRKRKSVKRWMIEEKIPQGHREGIPVLEENGKIRGIPGLGADSSAHPNWGEPAWHIITTNKRKDLSSWQN